MHNSTPAEDSAIRQLEPSSERGVALRVRMQPDRWAREVELAHYRVRIVHEVRALHRETRQEGNSLRECLRRVDSTVHWSTFCHWRRLLGRREGPEWERLLDGRVPPAPPPVPQEVQGAVVLMRRVDPFMSCASAREHLVAQFGDTGRISDSTLHRIWRRANQTNVGAGDPSRFETIEQFPGGAALVMMKAAAEESGVFAAMAEAALQAGRESVGADAGGREQDPHPGRDHRGRITKAYNKAIRAGLQSGEADLRWSPDDVKRQVRALGNLSILGLRPETLAARLFSIGTAGFISELRGFDGLDCPQARWARAAGGHDYHPFTLDKTLAELSLLKTDSKLMDAHSRIWAAQAQRWSVGGPPWLAAVLYVDGTSDPLWTGRYALSGKITRLGRVGPCVQRALVMGGPGVPLLVSAWAGTQSIRDHLLPMLEPFIEDAEDESYKISIFDSEGATAGVLTELNRFAPRLYFVSVKKGKGMEKALELTGPWIRYRERDMVAEGLFKVTGEGAPKDGLLLRAVVLRRPGSRNPVTTIFITNAPLDVLSTEHVVDAYLSRWPNQENVFRRARQKGVLSKTHGYTGEFVVNVALEPKREKAANQAVAYLSAEDAARLQARQMEFMADNAGSSDERDVLLGGAKTAAKAATAAAKRARKAGKKYDQLSSTPSKIWKRDLTRENICSILSLSAMMLVEWVLKEYFGGVRMELSTFLANFFHLPVQVRTSWGKIVYVFETGDLKPERERLLVHACAEMTKRGLRRDGRRLIFETAPRLAQIQGRPT